MVSAGDDFISNQQPLGFDVEVKGGSMAVECSGGDAVLLLRVHDLRHTCASMLIAAGAHPRHVREHLGRSSIRVTMDVYGHLYQDVRDEIAVIRSAHS